MSDGATPSEATAGALPADPPAPFDRAGLLAGARQALPVAVSVFSYALVFGVLARQAGLGWPAVLLMSGLVFAGTAQFVALGLWQSPPPVLPLVLTALIVNLRHLLMGATIQPLLAGRSRLARYGSAFFLTDENWALTVAAAARGLRNGAFLLGSGLPIYAAWVGGGLIGWAMGAAAPDPARWGLDFAFTAVFLALLAGLWRGRGDLLPWALAALAAVAARQWLPGTWYIIVGGVLGSLVAAARHGR